MSSQVQSDEVESAVRWMVDHYAEHPIMRRLSDIPEAPEVVKRQYERMFRSGVESGFDFAIECLELLCRQRGFSRPTEIANILWEWSNNFRSWVIQDGDEWIMAHDGPLRSLKFDHESWQSIRARVLRRDRECKRCGDVLQLEVDHIVEVQHGGLPTDDNLRVLCNACHKTKKFWESRNNE